MRVLTTGPDPNVPMDGMIHIGAQYEIKDMLGEHESIHINLMAKIQKLFNTTKLIE